MKFNGSIIKELREKHNWTQLEVAGKLAATGKFKGQTRQRIHQIESGNHASAKTICALCEVFQVSPDVLFED